MKCPKCDEHMQADCDDEKYVCECGKEIKWSKEYEESKMREL